MTVHRHGLDAQIRCSAGGHKILAEIVPMGACPEPAYFTTAPVKAIEKAWRAPAGHG